jgi:hypothetical protein
MTTMTDGVNDNNRDTLFRYADQLPDPLWDDVRARDARQAAVCVGGRWEEGLFKVPLLGFTYAVDPVAQRITRSDDVGHRVGYQTGVVLLYTLAKSVGAPPSGRMVSPLELTGGAMFFTGAHSLATKPLARRFGGAPQMLIERAIAMGGEAINGAADYAVRLPGLPYLPLYVLLWTGDKADEARAFIGIDDRALFHLDLGAVFALTNVLVSRLR